MVERIDIPGENFHIEVTYEDKNKLIFAFFSNSPYGELTEEDKKKIMEDVRGLGKWRIFKNLKKELERNG